MENENIKLLNAIYKNVDMGTHAIDSILNKIEDNKLKKLITKQNKIYETISADCQTLSAKLSEELSGINPFAKISSSATINMKTLMNNEASHIAEMMIQGTTMGITDIIKALGEFESAHPEIKNIAIRLQHSEEEFVDSLKTFLVKK